MCVKVERYARKVKKAIDEGGIKLLAKRSLSLFSYKFYRIRPVDKVARKLSVDRLHNFSEQERIVQPDKAVLEAYEFEGYGQYKDISPGQNPSELIDLAGLVEEINPDIVAEIGTARGGTLYVWAQSLETPNKFLSIDLPGGRFGGGYSQGRAKFYSQFTKEEIVTLRRNSHDEETKSMLSKELNGEKIDFLLIDGDHTYEGVKQDFQMYKEFVSEGGIIAFHDILPHPKLPDCNVDKFWKEIKEDYETTELVAKEGQGWAGIGIVRLSTE